MAHEQAGRAHEFRLGEDAAKRLLERRDHDRRLAHDALADKIRILARAAKQQGRSIAWWKKITGIQEDRYKIGGWALHVEAARTIEMAQALDEDSNEADAR